MRHTRYWGIKAKTEGIAFSGECDPVVGSINGIIKADGVGNITAALEDIDYLSPPTFDGVVEASKAVQVDLNKDVQGFNNLTASGELKAPIVKATSRGSAASPSIPMGDLDSGWYEEYDDQIAASIAGTRRFRIKAATTDFYNDISVTGTAYISGEITGKGGTISAFDVEAQSIDLGSDPGIIALIDCAVTSSSAAETKHGTRFQVDSVKILDVTAESDGAGSIQNPRASVSGELTVSGEVYVTGPSTFRGKTSYTPSGTQTLSDDGTIQPNATVVRVAGNGGAAVLDADPAIANGSEDGQILYVIGTHDTNTVQIADGVNTQLSGGSAFTAGQGDTISFIWDNLTNVWLELSRSDNS
jgi:hypothetical protein